MEVADRPIRGKRAAKGAENMSGKGEKSTGMDVNDDQLPNLKKKRKQIVGRNEREIHP